MRCKICKKIIKFEKEKKYTVEIGNVADKILNNCKVYEAIDCPKCGCQNLLGIRETNILPEKDNYYSNKRIFEEVSNIWDFLTKLSVDIYDTKSYAQNIDRYVQNQEFSNCMEIDERE